MARVLGKFLCGFGKRDLSVRKCPQNDLKKVEHLRTFVHVAMGTFAAPYCTCYRSADPVPTDHL